MTYDNITGHNNANGEWLTYETLFNHKKFRRSDQRRHMGQFRMALQHARIILSGNVPDATLTRLREAFFPELLDNNDLRQFLDRPWEPAYDRMAMIASKALRNTSVVMPYNYRDNSDEALAIGTAPETRHSAVAGAPKAALTRLNTEWPMWSTASRSCVVQLGRVKAAAAPWPDVPAPAPGEIFQWQMGAGGQFEANDINNPDRQTVANLQPDRFSVKTGVMFVGRSEQGGASVGGKATLEENSILACLRSEYVARVDQLVGHDPVNDPELVLLPEILTVTEDLGAEPGDGFQIRDLSRLRPTHRYLPALSIPYIGADAAHQPVLDTLADRWAARADDGWVNYWSQYYASRLGAAKALLLARYGLQLSTPNPQNFLIEFTNVMLPTGRLVIRDLGDAQLHTEAVWALGGIGGAAPASLRNVNGLADPLLRYESTVLSGQGPYYPAETGPHSNHDAYPGRTQLHWHFYSSLGKGISVLTASPVGTDPDARASGWQRVLQVNAIWGLAHNCAYVTKLESLLGLSFGIEWTTAPDPNTYTNLGDQDYHAAEARWRQDVNWERAQAAKIHAELCGGTARNALRAYRERRWAPGQSVEFQVNATTKWGQNILVVGGNTALGNWGPTSGIPMSAASYPVWTAKAQLPATSNVEYKYIRVDTDGSITWENGDNRVVGTGNGANPQQEHGNWR